MPVGRRGDDVLERGQLRAVEPCRSRCGRRTDDDGSGADRRELALELGGRAERVERDRDEAGAEHGQVRHHEVPVVGADDRDPVAGLEPEADQPAPERRDLRAQLAVGRRAAPADQGDGVVGVGLDDRRQVHGRRVEHITGRSRRRASSPGEEDELEQRGAEDQERAGRRARWWCRVS